MTVPVLHDPAGDPAGVRLGARRLGGAAESITATARGLSDLNQQAVQAWESQAQRLFSLVADQFGQVIEGSGGVASDLAAALDRYANILESCQNEVRSCRQRLNDLVASTPVGFAPDPAAVNGLVGQANQAYTRAVQAARELSDLVLGLIGGPSTHGQVPAPGDAHASFVSHAHNGGLASTHPSAAGFDVQAAQVQTQMNGVMGSLTGLATETRPPVAYRPPDYAMSLRPGLTTVVDATVAPSSPLTLHYSTPQPTLTASYIPGDQPSGNPQDLVLVTAPYSGSGTGRLGFLVNTSMLANPSGPMLSPSNTAYHQNVAFLSEDHLGSLAAVIGGYEAPSFADHLFDPTPYEQRSNIDILFNGGTKWD